MNQKKGDKLVNIHTKRIATFLEDAPKTQNRETMLELEDDATGEPFELRAFEQYDAGWHDPIPCWECKGWAPFSNLCQDCQEKQDDATRERCRAAIEDPKFSHARARQWGGQWAVSIYHRDPKSPSGVMLAASGSEAIVEPLLRQARRPGAISPTEGLRRG